MTPTITPHQKNLLRMTVKPQPGGGFGKNYLQVARMSTSAREAAKLVTAGYLTETRIPGSRDQQFEGTVKAKMLFDPTAAARS